MITEPATDPKVEPTTPRRPSRAGRRLWAVVRTLLVTVAVLGIVTLVCPGLFGAWSVRADGAVPRSIELPWQWQANAEMAPPGPAAVLATGDPAPNASGVLSVADRSDGATANPIEVVGRNGVYRSLYPVSGQWHAGEDVRLSPDGNRIALPYLHDQNTARRGPVLVDLTTGRTDVVTATGLPAHDSLTVLGWRPDGGALLVAAVTGETARVALVDLGTGATTVLADVPVPAGPVGWRFAFSPDGRRVVYAAAGSLHLVADDGRPLWTVPLPAGALVAGEGAFTADGGRIALVHAKSCPHACAGAAEWSVTYVDSADGTVVSGPALPTIEAAQVRAIGWRADGTGLILVRYLPHPLPAAVQNPDGSLSYPTTTGDDPTQTGPADLYELSPGLAPRLLLDAPYAVTDLDVAADLVEAGRFDGDGSTPSLLPIETGRVRPLDVALAVAVLGGFAAVVTVAGSLLGRLTRRLVVRLRRDVHTLPPEPTAH